MRTDICANAKVAVAGQPQAHGLLAGIARWPQLALALLTVLCLLPFSGKPFHIDDPIFVWTAQHISKHPLDFYGFAATWWSRATPMWQIQQNPPLAAYYMALIGLLAGWSERALHLGFIVPAVVVVLTTYHVARRFTRRAWIAAAVTLVAPGFLVSATGLMCDVSMLALWLLAIIFWLKGLDPQPQPAYLTIAAFLIAACALTKYFGISLVPLLFVYTLVRQRSFRGWIAYLAIPLVILGGYEFYTYKLYGYGLLSLAAGSPSIRRLGATTITVVRRTYFRPAEAPLRCVVGLAFAGGCVLPGLTFVPLLWSRRQILWGGLVSGLFALAFFFGWIHLGDTWLHAHRGRISVQLFFYVAGGLSILSLAVADFWKRRDAALLLGLWIFGTMLFAVVVNWDVNARTVMPMIPAVAILLARRVEGIQRWQVAILPASLIVSAAISLWVAAGDMALANTARAGARYAREKTREDSAAVWFEGRWGFEYYMQQFGARPVEPEADQCHFGDLVVIPKYNTAQFPFPLKTTQEETVGFNIHTWVTPMNPDAGAGFYFSGWGPLPFVFGPVPTEEYFTSRVPLGK